MFEAQFSEKEMSALIQVSQSQFNNLKTLLFAQFAEAFVQNNQIESRIKWIMSKCKRIYDSLIRIGLLLTIRIEAWQVSQLDTGNLFHILFIEYFDQRFFVCQLQNRFSIQVWQINNNASKITFTLAHSLWLFRCFSLLKYLKSSRKCHHSLKMFEKITTLS